MNLQIKTIDDLNPERYRALQDECLSHIEVFTREGWSDKAATALKECGEITSIIKACERFAKERTESGTLLALGNLLDARANQSADPLLRWLVRGIKVGETVVTPSDMLTAVADERKRRALDNIHEDIQDMDERIREFGHPLHPKSNRPPHHRMYRRILMGAGFNVIPAPQQYGGNTISVTNECVTYEVEAERFDPETIHQISEALAEDGLFFKVNSEVRKDIVVVRWNISGWVDADYHRSYDTGEASAIASVEKHLKKMEKVR